MMDVERWQLLRSLSSATPIVHTCRPELDRSESDSDNDSPDDRTMILVKSFYDVKMNNVEHALWWSKSPIKSIHKSCNDSCNEITIHKLPFHEVYRVCWWIKKSSTKETYSLNGIQWEKTKKRLLSVDIRNDAHIVWLLKFAIHYAIHPLFRRPLQFDGA